MVQRAVERGQGSFSASGTRLGNGLEGVADDQKIDLEIGRACLVTRKSRSGALLSGVARSEGN